MGSRRSYKDLEIYLKSFLFFFNSQTLELLLTKQIRLNFQDEDQYTAMYLAAKADRVEHVEALGRAGAAVNDRDEEGKTALHAAALNGSRLAIFVAIIVAGGVESTLFI